MLCTRDDNGSHFLTRDPLTHRHLCSTRAIQACVDPRPLDRDVRRWPLLLSGAG